MPGQVPPVGLEPTLRTLLGDRPLPLGYGGALIVPRFCYLSPDRYFLLKRSGESEFSIPSLRPKHPDAQRHRQAPASSAR